MKGPVSLLSEEVTFWPDGRGRSPQHRTRSTIALAEPVAARQEPGLFRTAFSASENLGDTANPAKAGEGGLTPFQLLGSALDGLVEAGVLPPERRPGAEFLAWSAVHGLGMLLIDGPLRGLDAATGDDIGRRLIDMVERGL